MDEAIANITRSCPLSALHYQWTVSKKLEPGRYRLAVRVLQGSSYAPMSAISGPGCIEAVSPTFEVVAGRNTIDECIDRRKAAQALQEIEKTLQDETDARMPGLRDDYEDFREALAVELEVGLITQAKHDATSLL